MYTFIYLKIFVVCNFRYFDKFCKKKKHFSQISLKIEFMINVIYNRLKECHLKIIAV